MIVNEPVTFRRSLERRQKYALETQFLVSDAKATFFEQRFVMG